MKLNTVALSLSKGVSMQGAVIADRRPSTDAAVTRLLLKATVFV